MFWNMLGANYGLATSNKLKDTTRLYWLNNANIEIPETLKNKLDKHYYSNKGVNDLQDEVIKYTYTDGTQKDYKLKEILFFSDITNGIDNWFDSPSRLDALYKVISNSELALDAKNINLKFSGKFLVGGDKDQQKQDLHSHSNLSKEEKKSLEDSLTDHKHIKSYSQAINVERFVSDLRNLELDQAFEHDYFTIGQMYNIPKEILSIYLRDSNALTDGSKQRSIARHIDYSIKPKADDLANGLETYFGYDKEGKDITITYDHLPCMQIFNEDKAKVNYSNARTLESLLKSGVKPEDAVNLLGMEVEFKEPEDEEQIDTEDTEENQ